MYGMILGDRRNCSNIREELYIEEENE